MADCAEELPNRRLAAVEDDADIRIACGPHIGEAASAAGHEELVEPGLELVEGTPQRVAPLLLPIPARLAAAVAPPALDAVDAAPRAVLVDFDLPLGRVQFEELAVV